MARARRTGPWVCSWAAMLCLWSASWHSAIAPSTAAATPWPLDMDLSGHWRFAYTPQHAGVVAPADRFRASMPIPGCWDDQFSQAEALRLWPDARRNPEYQPIRYPMPDRPPDASLPFLLGTGWYARSLEVPSDWKGCQITLHVGRVVMEAWVYVNGQQVHHHLGHSTSWEVDLAPHLVCGQANELVLAVDNHSKGRTGTAIRGWQGRSGGVFGPIRLHVAGQARIADLYVREDDAGLHWHAEIEGRVPEPATLEWQIDDPTTGKAVARGNAPAGGGTLRWSTGRFGLEPWSDRNPRLYTLSVRLVSGGRQLDTMRQDFGRRRLTTAGTGLRLNGQPIFLRGVCDIAYFPLTCTLPWHLEAYREYLRRLKQVGFNWIRCHTWVPPEPYLQAADALGMLIQVEPPVGYRLPEWRDILRACRHHPSVVIYCCGNEELLDEAKIEYLRQCAAELRAQVPDALFNPQEALRGVVYGWAKSDMGGLVPKPFPHNAERLRLLKQFSDVFGQFSWGWLSYTSLAGQAPEIDKRLAVYERPCLSHELGICGCFLDLKLEERYRPTRIGPALFSGAREALARAGLLDRAELYHRHSAAWQRLMLKDAMETARRCQLLAGYDCLGGTDGHWHRTGYGCGVLNEFGELKPGRTVEDILSYNGESVLLVSDQRARNLESGTRFQRDLFLSWFGAAPLLGGELAWSMRPAAGGPALCTGSQPVPTVAPGTIRQVGAVEFELPALDRPLKTVLQVTLTSQAQPVKNRWDYWIFPNARPIVPQGVRVVQALDAQSLRALAEGQRVVLLGHQPFAAQPTSFQMGLAGRPQGNLATVIARHPLMDGFPHDGWCDWQFAAMLHGGQAVQFDPMPEAFEPLLEVVSSYKQIRKQAALFEWRVGQGRLLVCSLHLPESDPAARYLRSRILTYAAGEQFQPRIEVTLDRLAELGRSGPGRPRPAAGTDQGWDERGQLPRKADSAGAQGEKNPR